MGPAFVPEFGENVEHFTFKGMMSPRHPNLSWVVSEVGSVSEISLTPYRTAP